MPWLSHRQRRNQSYERLARAAALSGGVVRGIESFRTALYEEIGLLAKVKGLADRVPCCDRKITAAVGSLSLLIEPSSEQSVQEIADR